MTQVHQLGIHDRQKELRTAILAILVMALRRESVKGLETGTRVRMTREVVADCSSGSEVAIVVGFVRKDYNNHSQT